MLLVGPMPRSRYAFQTHPQSCTRFCQSRIRGWRIAVTGVASLADRPLVQEEPQFTVDRRHETPLPIVLLTSDSAISFAPQTLFAMTRCCRLAALQEGSYF